MRMQKQITTGLALLAGLTLLAGCGSHQGDKAASATTSSQRIAKSTSRKPAHSSTSSSAASAGAAQSNSATAASTSGSQAQSASMQSGVPADALIKRPNQAIGLYAHAMAIMNEPGRFSATQVPGGWRVVDNTTGIGGQVNFDGSEPDDNGGTIPYSQLSAPDHLGAFQLPAPK